MIKNTIIALVVLALVVGGYIYYKNNAKDTVAPVTTERVEGCYIAKLNKDVYTLKIDTQEGENVAGSLKYKNFEKDSSSGPLTGTYKDNILLGTYSFDSEGMHSNRQVIFKKDGDKFIQGFGPITVVNDTETFSDLTKITYDPKSTFIKSPTCDDSITYTEAAGTYSFTYDSDFVVTNGEKKLTDSWNVYPVGKGVVLSKLTIPKSYMPGTNFSEAVLEISRSSDVNAIKSCAVVPKDSAGVAAGSVTIANYPFQKILFKEGAMGSFYDTTSYRGILDGDCYVIEYTIHSTNIGNYPPEQGIKEFNKTAITQEMENIIKSLHFQLASD